MFVLVNFLNVCICTQKEDRVDAMTSVDISNQLSRLAWKNIFDTSGYFELGVGIKIFFSKGVHPVTTTPCKCMRLLLVQVPTHDKILFQAPAESRLQALAQGHHHG